MPPATSGRYKSRLFNFFHQQSRRWGEQFERTIKHLEVTANWSLQALLYPVYLLIRKATESSGKQLHTNEQQSKPQLQGNETENPETSSSSVDTPIQRVLETVVTLQIKEAKKQNSPLSFYRSVFLSIFPPPHLPTTPSPHHPITPPPTTLQAIASLLTNRNLVLVTAENEILDILTPQQQEKLQNRILEEIAKYWRSWQSPQLGDETKLLPEIDRLLNKLISGKKESTPALSESTETENKNQYQSLPIISRGLPLLDAAIAQIESYAIAIAPISRASGQLLQAVQTQLNIFLYGKQQQLTTKQTALDADWEHQISKIQALIWGAVHYFFGERKTKKLEPKTPKNIGSNQKSKTAKLPKRHPSPALPKSPDLANQNIEDPWLTMDDLFGDLQEFTEDVHEQQFFVTTSESTKSALPPSPFLRKTRQINSISPLAQRALRAQIRDAEASTPTSLKIQNSKYVFRTRYTLVQPLRKKHKSWKFSLSSDSVSSKSSSKSESETNKAEILRHQQNTTQVEAKPDWIETQAHTIGYDKHFLERILESLDYVMLWLEDIFVKIGVFLRRLSQRK